MGSVVICFWGLTRSLKYTIENLKSVIQSFGDPIICLHTYSMKDEYTNLRANEKNIRLNPDEWKLLNPHYHLIEDQSEVISQLDLEKYRENGDPWNTDFQTLNNFVLGMYSLKQVTQLMLKNVSNVKYVIFMRPDVLFVEPTTPFMANMLTKKSIVVPKFHSWLLEGKIHKRIGGINDRFAICKKSVAKIYGNRFDHLLSYSQQKPPHSETFLRDILKHFEIEVIRQPICFHRVRATGKEEDDC
jgi:hypothetical protein